MKINAFDIETVKCMVNFMYGIDKTSLSGECTRNPTELLLSHVRVNVIADYYDIPNLSKLANAEISRLLQTTWSVDSFLAAIKEASSSTGNIELHRLLADITAEHIEELIYLESFAKLEVINDFTMQLIRGCVEKIERLQTLECARPHLETVIAYERLQRESETARANKVIDNIRQCLQTLSETKCCRN